MNQLNLFGNPVPSNQEITNQAGRVILENGEYVFIPGFFNQGDSEHYFKILRETVEWKQESMSMYGKKIDFPRLIAWYGDEGAPYSFSGVTLQPSQWTKELLEIKDRIESPSHVPFNSLLLNFYRNGQDSVGWHSDAEPGLGKNPVIASVSFGAARKFQLRNLQTKDKIDIQLTHGSLLVMQGALQHHWQHQVPKTSKQIGERINLTFRVVK